MVVYLFICLLIEIIMEYMIWCLLFIKFLILIYIYIFNFFKLIDGKLNKF